MSSPLFYIALGLSVFMLSLLGTRVMIITLRRRAAFLDRPNLRSNHVMPTPRGGGIAVVMAIIIGLLATDINFGIVLALFMLAAISLLDDLISVPPFVRLMVQIMAIPLPLAMMPSVWGDYLPVWLDKGLTALLWLWFTNLFNFMDGIDGLAATEMIGIGLGFCLMAAFAGLGFPHALFAYCLVVATAACGFLWWNWHPAKIFLGDVGSIPIGFLLGYILLKAAAAGFHIAALILPAYYLADGTITLCRRLWQGKKIWEAHSEHFYQKAVRRGRRHDVVARLIFGVNLLLILLATLSMLYPELALLYLAVAYIAVFTVLAFFAYAPVEASHER